MGVDPLTAGVIAAPIVGGIMGAEEGRRGRRAAEQARAQAAAQFAGIDIPDVEAQRLELALPEFLGEYQPTLEELTELGPTAMEQISTDPRLAQAQMQALETLSEIGETGLTPGERAAMRSMQRQVAQQEKARQESILQEMARRGVAGGGQELAARLSSSQAAATRGAEQADRLAMQAQARALQALTGAGQLGGQIRQQEFGEQADVAQAMDAIARWNAANQQQVQSRNVAAQQQAGLRNLSERQRLAEQQAAMRNYQQEANKRLLQQQFENQMSLAGGRAGQYQGQAAAADQAAARAGQMWSGIGTGVGTGLAAIAGKPSGQQQTQVMPTGTGTQLPAGTYWDYPTG